MPLTGYSDEDDFLQETIDALKEEVLRQKRGLPASVSPEDLTELAFLVALLESRATKPTKTCLMTDCARPSVPVFRARPRPRPSTRRPTRERTRTRTRARPSPRAHPVPVSDRVWNPLA